MGTDEGKQKLKNFKLFDLPWNASYIYKSLIFSPPFIAYDYLYIFFINFFFYFYFRLPNWISRLAAAKCTRTRHILGRRESPGILSQPSRLTARQLFTLTRTQFSNSISHNITRKMQKIEQQQQQQQQHLCLQGI